jgi:hypothetical protein
MHPQLVDTGNRGMLAMRGRPLPTACHAGCGSWQQAAALDTAADGYGTGQDDASSVSVPERLQVPELPGPMHAMGTAVLYVQSPTSSLDMTLRWYMRS